MLKAVNEYICNRLHLAEVRALGIIDKFVTGPLWRLIETRKNILEMKPFLFRLKLKLCDLCKDASPIFEEQCPVFDNEVEMHKDELFYKLFEETGDTEFDVLTQQCLEVVFHAILIILERQCVDQLPGGKYWCPTEKVQRAAENVPTTNKASQSDFAILDLRIRMKPNANIETLQAYTMWYRNETLQWLDSKSDSEREEIVNTVSKNYYKMKLKYEERRQELKVLKAKRLEEKQRLKKAGEEKSDTKKVSVVSEMVALQIQAWLTIEMAEEKYSQIENSKLKTKILQTQLDFYKFVMNVKCPAKYFYRSKTEKGKRHMLSNEELFDNLKTVINTRQLPEPTKLNTEILKDKEERNKLFEEHKSELYEKIKSARMVQFNKKQKFNMFPEILKDPLKLVGKSIRHKIRETDEDEYLWCKGEVNAIHKETVDPRRTV